PVDPTQVAAAGWSQLDRAVGTEKRQVLTVGRERHPERPGRKLAQVLAGGRVPDVDDFVLLAAGDQALTVGGEGDVVNEVVRVVEAAQLLAGGRVPGADGIVPSGRDQYFATGEEGAGNDFAAVAFGGVELLAGGRVPQVNGVVAAGRGQQLAV